MKPIVAAGTVLWRWDDLGGLEVALVHRPKYDDWSLPKGKAEAGEHPIAAAVRETMEEAGFTGPLGRPLGQVSYAVDSPDGPVPKVVHYFVMPALGGVFTPSTEVDRLEWLPACDAAARLTRVQDREVLARFSAGPAEAVTVLLVRHGSAGDRKKWRGSDADRPLDAVGQAQAELLAAAGLCFGVQSVHAADVVRCVQTVLPLAAALGVSAEPMADFAEGEPAHPIGTAVDALDKVVALGRHAAVCSQGGVIPHLLAALTARDGVPLPALRSRKGSVWVLSFDKGRLAAGSYLADLSPPL